MGFDLPREDRARGLMAGLLLGDALGDSADGDVPLTGTCLSQLACFTLEGMIRASVRAAHRGICNPAAVVWNAYGRWAALQGLVPSPHLSDGWLHHVAPLAVRRGSAPATVAALRSGRMGTPSAPASPSAGHHALTRTLPVALFASSLANPGGLARDLAALTHGAATAWDAAESGVALVARALQEPDPATMLATLEPVPKGPDGTAAAALATGVAAARTCPRGEDIVAGILVARSSGGSGAATFAGALLGAAHGYLALPRDHVARLELGWVADRLARHALREQTCSPSGSEYAPAADGSWWGLYPGW